MNVLKEVVDVASTYGNVSAENIQLEHSFIGDLGLDSLDLVQAVMELEETFNVDLPDDELQSVDTVAQLVGMIEVHIASKVNS